MRKNKLLHQGIEEYLAHLKVRGLEPRSIKTHRQPLTKALESWGNIYINRIEAHHIDLLFARGDWGPRTRNMYLGNLRQFFAYCRRQKWVDRDFDPSDGWRNVKVPKEEMPRIGVEEFLPLLQAATEPRDRAVVALGLFTFCRGSEIQTLRIRDINFSESTVEIYRHKTKEPDTLPLVAELAQEMTLWLNFYREQQGRLDPDWYLVPSKGPLPMSWDHALGKLQPTGAPALLRPTQPMTHPYRAVQRPLRAIGMDESGTGGHVLRRSGARALFDRLRGEGYDGALMRVSSMLGHSSTKITEHYLGLGIERTQRNELLAGKPMFPGLVNTGSVANLRAV